jgi:hypothetical protein
VAPLPHPARDPAGSLAAWSNRGPRLHGFRRLLAIAQVYQFSDESEKMRASSS